MRSLGYIATVEPGSQRGFDKDPKDYIESALALFHGAQAFLDERWQVAQRLLLKAIELDPEGKEAHSYLAATYNELRRYDLAVEYATRSLELPPHAGEAAVRITLAQALMGLGRSDEALVHLEAAAETNPNNPRIEALLQAAGQAR